jgi:hypothetical protein
LVKVQRLRAVLKRELKMQLNEQRLIQYQDMIEARRSSFDDYGDCSVLNCGGLIGGSNGLRFFRENFRKFIRSLDGRGSINQYTTLGKSLISQTNLIHGGAQYRFNSKTTDSKVRSVLSQLKIVDYKNDFSTQKYIENTLYENFESIFVKSNKGVIINGIDKDLLGVVLHKYITDMTPYLIVYIGKLLEVQNNSSDKEALLYNEILKCLDEKFLYNLCLITFLQVYTNQHTDNDKSYVVVPVLVKLGKKIASYYLNHLKDLHIDNSGGSKIFFSEFKRIWEEKHPDFVDLISDDTFLSRLGAKIMDILTTNKMLEKILVKIPGEKNKKHSVLEVTNKSLLDSPRVPLFDLSIKLPMVCTPIKYKGGVLGGYVLNNDKYEEDIFISKKGYRDASYLKTNTIYDMLNKTSAIPFKVNIEVLNYLDMYGVQQGLIMDSNTYTSHEFSNKPDLKAFEKKEIYIL